jgi:hypothetical protein
MLSDADAMRSNAINYLKSLKSSISAFRTGPVVLTSIHTVLGYRFSFVEDE